MTQILGWILGIEAFVICAGWWLGLVGHGSTYVRIDE